MITELLNYYLFEYEIEVYPKYTQLNDHMIRNKMRHFWLLLKKRGYQTQVKKIMAAFYNKKENGGGQYIVLDDNTPDRPRVRTFETTPPVNNFLGPDDNAVFVPYYLFNNKIVAEVAREFKRIEDYYEGYEKLKNHKMDFIYRKAFQLKNNSHWEKTLKKNLLIYKKRYEHDNTYQELWCIIVFKKKQPEVTDFNLQRLSDSFAMTIKEWGLDILRDNDVKQKRAILRHGTRSAVAAIMGRNMSHNIGSHVLSYWAKFIDEEDLNDTQSENKNDWIRYSKFLFEYLRARMDFIAEISTTNPVWVAPMKFCEDVLYPFLKQTALLNHIALSEGIHFENCSKLLCAERDHHRIIFEVFYKGNSLFTWHFNEDANCIYYEGRYGSEAYSITNKNIKFKDNDPIVAIPHGITGVHAFYSILENFIRNSAKHGGNQMKNKSPFKIKIALDDSFEDLIKITISDNIGNCKPDIIRDINKSLREKLTDKSGIINPGNWGLKEKKISACYLRMGGPDDVDTSSNFPPRWSKEAKTLKYLIPSCDECRLNLSCRVKESNVCYDFYLQKPKEAIILLQTDSEKQQGHIVQRLADRGIAEIYVNDLSDRIKKNIPHRFLVNLLGDSEDIKRKAPYLPMRQIQINDRLYKTAISDKDPILKFYEIWFDKHYLNQLANNEKLHIIFRSNCPQGISIDNGMIKYTNQNNFDDLEGNKIIFDDHSDGITKCKIKTDKSLYYQGVSAANPTKRLLERMENTVVDDSKLRLRMFELAEAALTRILIADERIWKTSLKLDSNLKAKGIEKMKRELLHLMNIHLVEVQNKKVQIKTIQGYVDELKPNFIIIHQGLIDKMSDNERLKLIDILSGHHSFFVITSGRGLPNDIKNKNFSSARFLEISALEKFIEEYDKLALVQVLYALRRPLNV
jgi:hypothetical protein